MYSARFAAVYDSLMGDYSSINNTVKKLVEKYGAPRGSLLELGCGTGNILQSFSEQYKLYGLDHAPGMLSIAKKKVPSATFYTADMTSFSIKKKFNIILCVFDSVNHLLTLQLWLQVFVSVRKHLEPDGIFIFDMNTPRRLKALAAMPPYVKKLDDQTISCTKVTVTKEDIYKIRFQLFENITNSVEYFEETVQETTFPTRTIKNSLEKLFTVVTMVDPIRPHITSQTGRVFFVCKLK